jgi:myo-inositol-1(or 4)-monophosphatase
MDYPENLERVAYRVAVAAADLVRSRIGRARVVDIKSTPTDVVTQADLEVETLIRRELLEATPGAAICGEEEGTAAGTTSLRWIVDPIDGTVNFLYNLPVVSVSIAAEINGVVVAGAVADVVRGEVFRGSIGNGVRCDGDQVSPSAASDLADSLVGTGFSYSADERRVEGEVVARVLPEARDIRNFGSAALHLVWVAAGRLEAFYQRGLNEWDLAAGAFLAGEAGARVELGSEDNGGLVLVAAPAIFDQLRNLLAM